MEALSVLLLSVIIASGSATNPFLRYVPRGSIKWSPSSEGDPGEPLFLTPYIQKGEIAEGEFAAATGREGQWVVWGDCSEL